VKRQGAGICKCRGCRKVVASAWTFAIPSATTVRNTISSSPCSTSVTSIFRFLGICESVDGGSLGGLGIGMVARGLQISMKL
jgi:Ribosomal L37ae protein family